MLLILLLFIPQVLLFFSFCDASDGEKRLFDTVFANHNTDVRPRRDSNQSVVISLELVLYQLKDLDERAEVLYSSAAISSEWDNDYLTWKPEDYDGVKELVVLPTKVWLPDIGIENSAGKFYDENFFELFRVHVYHTGRVRWWFGGVMETSCHIDGTLFPFDSQSCCIVIQSWAHSEALVDLRNASSKIHLEKFNDDDIWEVIGSSVRRRGILGIEQRLVYPEVEFIIYLDRKPLFYIVNIIIPIMFLVIVVLMVYWLPPDSSDKISLSITVLLSFSVLLFVVTDSIPPSSEHTPVLGVFVTVTMAISTMSVIESIIVMRLCSIRTYKIPPVIRFIAFRLVGRALCLTRSPTSSAKGCDRCEKIDCQAENGVDESLLGDMAIPAKSSTELVDKINDLLVELRKITGRQEKDDMEEETAEEWRDLGNVLDRLLFFVSLITLSSITVWMVIQSAKEPHTDGHST